MLIRQLLSAMDITNFLASFVRIELLYSTNRFRTYASKLIYMLVKVFQLAADEVVSEL